MIDHEAMQLALRVRLQTLSVATTGSMALASTVNGFTRASGSFLTDGFRPGMELTAAGFTTATNTEHVITEVTATTLTVASALTAQTSASGRTLTVGLPSVQAWENQDTTPTAGTPYVVEQYLPGPTRQVTVGSDGYLEVAPLYVVQVHVPLGVGMGAAAGYADAIIALFAPGTSLTVGSDVLRVRTDTGPYRGQARRLDSGWVVVPVTLPCRLRTQNAIA